MLLNFFFSSLALAGIGRVWGKLQQDFPALKKNIKEKMPSFISKALTCSFCFTFWTSFLFVLIFNPLQGWLPTSRFYIADNLKNIISIFFSWMIIGTGSWIIRFVMDELQHLVHYHNHILKEKTGHK